VTACLFLLNLLFQTIFSKQLSKHWSVKIQEYEDRKALNLSANDPLPGVSMSPSPGSGGVVARLSPGMNKRTEKSTYQAI